MSYKPGRHFLQLPGPTNVPDRILHALENPTIDHRSADFAALTMVCLEGMKAVFQTRGDVIIYPGSATGAWESALVNTLSAGDKVLTFDNGHFGAQWARVAKSFGLNVDLIGGNWRCGADPEALAARLNDDTGHEIRAVLAIHNETSTGVTSDIAAIRRAMDAAEHPALLMVDTVSSLGSIDYRHDEWGVDVAVAGSQKGLMLPPGLCFNAISEKALAAGRTATLPRNYWRWEEMREANRIGFFPYTPSTNLLYGLREAVRMLVEEEGLPNVFSGISVMRRPPVAQSVPGGLSYLGDRSCEFSPSATAILMPEGFNEADLRAVVLKHFDMSLGSGLGKLAGKVFRIGHLGSFNDLMLAGTLCGVEMGLKLAGVPHQPAASRRH